MKHLSLLLIIVCGSVSSAAAESEAKPEAAAQGPAWVNISADFTKQIGADEINPAYSRRCIGMIVSPDGDIVIQTATKGICTSHDQGATWSVVEGNKITGRCETGDGFSIPYPYDGRLAFFGIDGSGGISLDSGATWRPFTQFQRMLQFADVDWSQKDPQVIFGQTHEPFFTVLSTDGGKSWQKVFTDAENGKDPHFNLGIIDSTTLVRAPVQHGGIDISTDTGQTWATVADYSILGRRPVHYGKNTYWTTTAGVIVSNNGKDWTLTGKGAENACYGPYFGTNENEFMVVTKQSFLVTRDGGKTWQAVAPLFIAPDIFRRRFDIFVYYGWDAKHDIVYASGLGASVHQLRLK